MGQIIILLCTFLVLAKLVTCNAHPFDLIRGYRIVNDYSVGPKPALNLPFIAKTTVGKSNLHSVVKIYLKRLLVIYGVVAEFEFLVAYAYVMSYYLYTCIL